MTELVAEARDPSRALKNFRRPLPIRNGLFHTQINKPLSHHEAYLPIILTYKNIEQSKMEKHVIKYFRYGVSMILVLICQSAEAGSAASGTVIRTVSFPSGVFVFFQNGTRTSPPSCAASYPTRWAIDVTTAGGQAAQANLLTAFATGRQVEVVGNGTCSVDPISETVAYINVIA